MNYRQPIPGWKGENNVYPWQNENDYQEPRPKVTSVYQPNSLQDGVIVPGLQAIITGAVCGVAAAAVTAWFELPFWAIGATAAALATAGGWLSYRNRWQWLLERITGADLNADGYIGQPQPQQPQLPAPSIRVELAQNDGHQVDFIDLPYPEKLPALAAGLQQGRTFSLSTWTGSGALFSRAEFEELRGELIRRGLAEWNNPAAPAQGVKLTAAGRAIFRRLATPTLPSGE